MPSLLAVFVIVGSVASLVAALVVAFAIRDARLMLHEARLLLHDLRHPRVVAPLDVPPPRKRTTSRAYPAAPLPYGAHHPTPDPAHPHASPFRSDTLHGTPAPKDPE